MAGKIALFVLVCLAALRIAPAQAAEKAAAEKVTVGIVGGFNAFVWPASIALANHLYAEHGVEPEIIFMPSSPGMLQQLAAGSLDVAASAGLVDPVRLVARKAGVAIARVSLHVSPYVLIAKPQFASIGDLKGKNVAIGSRNDMTFVLIVNMLAPFKLKPDDVDMMFSDRATKSPGSARIELAERIAGKDRQPCIDRPGRERFAGAGRHNRRVSAARQLAGEPKRLTLSAPPTTLRVDMQHAQSHGAQLPLFDQRTQGQC